MKLLEGLAIGALVLVAFAEAGPGWNATPVDGRFERTLTVTGPVDLDVRTGSGSIDVRTGEAGTVRVTARVRAWGSQAAEKVRRIEANPPVEQLGNGIRIGRFAERELQNGVSIQYEIVAPKQTRLASHSGAGNQAIDGVRGPVEAESGSGSLTVGSIEDALKARTGSGDIRASAVGGAFTGQTGSGSIRASFNGPGEARTGSGNIELRGVRGRLLARTGSGSITAEGEATAPWDVSTGSGNVSLRLPPPASFDLLLRAGSGRISTDHALAVQGSLNRHRLEGRVGAGGPLVSVSTGSGNIRIQ